MLLAAIVAHSVSAQPPGQTARTAAALPSATQREVRPAGVSGASDTTTAPRGSEVPAARASTPEWILDKLTAGILVVALLQLAAFVYQGWQLRRTVAVTRDMAEAQSRDMRRSLGIAQEAADATAAANTLNRDIFIATERPRVVVEAFADGPMVQSAEFCRIKVRFVMTNIGRAPAGHAVLAYEAFDANGGRPSIKVGRLVDRERAARAVGEERHGFNIYEGREVHVRADLSVAPNGGSNGRVLFIIAACVTYDFVDVRDALQSSFSFHVDWFDTPIVTPGEPARIIAPISVTISPWVEAPDAL